MTPEEYNRWIVYRDYESTYFVHIWSHLTDWLPVDIALDDDEYYKDDNHPLWIYFKNNHDSNSRDWLPLLISETGCYMPLDKSFLKITETEYNAICRFGERFHKEINLLANRELDFLDFCIAVRKSINKEYKDNENA